MNKKIIIFDNNVIGAKVVFPKVEALENNFGKLIWKGKVGN